MPEDTHRTIVTMEVIGFSDSPCGPFPCDSERSCELIRCHPDGALPVAFAELRIALAAEFGTRVSVTLTLIDDEVPERIKKIIEEHYPPIPIILINGKVTPVGRISLPHIRRELKKVLQRFPDRGKY
ncbi:MAG: hypothetical protein LUQ13_00395 [Methanomicrobiales archaeon]|nr:hypothetical protein [Methanomicrobiales archaeon]